jgi:hypothetical protein
VEASVAQPVAASVWGSVGGRLDRQIEASIGHNDKISVMAYYEASWLALFHFYATYLEPNKLQALARFNQMVSGYWLGADRAIIVRRPQVLSRDAQGRLHNATGACLKYRDGWEGVFAWHGVRVPEKVIIAPEQLTRDDFLNEQNLEIRRCIQERMGERFVLEFGRVIDSGPRGTLYEVRLPGEDFEEMARYVQVKDASTPRQYLLRVPPTIKTAAAGVAWSFGLSVKQYHPLQET